MGNASCTSTDQHDFVVTKDTNCWINKEKDEILFEKICTQCGAKETYAVAYSRVKTYAEKLARKE